MSLTVVLRSISSAIILSGSGLIAMALGIIDVDAGLWNVASAVIGPDTIGAKPFLMILGSAKVLGALGLWGVGPMPKPLAFAACAIPPACAIYGHSKLGRQDRVIAAGFYLGIVSALYVLERSKKSNSKKEK
jgi:hypothetical protein